MEDSSMISTLNRRGKRTLALTGGLLAGVLALAGSAAS
jgi:hypothetical protein